MKCTIMRFVFVFFAISSMYNNFAFGSFFFTLNSNESDIVVDIVYTGGCEEHEFRIMPVFDSTIYSYSFEKNKKIYLIDQILHYEDDCKSLQNAMLNIEKEFYDFPLEVVLISTADGFTDSITIPANAN